MSASPAAVAPPTSKVNAILDALNSASGFISIVLPLVGTLIPIAVQLVKTIRGTGASQTTTYSLVVAEDQAVLDAIVAGGGTILDVANAELTRLGLPVLVKP